MNQASRPRFLARRELTLLLIVCLGLSVMAIMSSRAPALRASPLLVTTGVPTTLTISGERFAPRDRYGLVLDLATSLGQIRSDQAGSFILTVSLPPLSPGEHIVRAVTDGVEIAGLLIMAQP